jgi:hypothetical protein
MARRGGMVQCGPAPCRCIGQCGGGGGVGVVWCDMVCKRHDVTGLVSSRSHRLGVLP